MWVYDNWFDLCSDLSAFHRVDDPAALPPQRLIDFSVRLPAYAGVVAARGRMEDDPVQVNQGDGVVDSRPAVLMADPVFGSMFDFGEVVD